ncbi:MAG: Crp/Fnr family transcriptional regulator [Acidobacteriota bacterium]
MSSEIADYLSKVPIFAELPREELENIARLFRERKYRKNDVIFLEEDTGQYLYLVREGRVKVTRLLPNGKEMILAFHDAGEYFGEMALIDGGTTPATVTAVLPTTLYIMGAREFGLLLENPHATRVLLKTLCQRCRDAWAQIEVLTFHNADARIRMAFYQLVKKRGQKTPKGFVIPMKLTHKELSDIVGISRETATRVLSHLQDEELVSVEQRRFVIPDPERLIEDLLFE